MPTKEELGEVYFERGTAPPKNPRRQTGSGLSQDMEGRTETAKAYRAPLEKHPPAVGRHGKKRWQSPYAEQKRTQPIEILPKKEREQIEAEAAADAKRLECPFELAFRPIRAADFNFILNAWLCSYQDSMRGMRRDAYFHGQQNLIAELAKRRNLVVGCDAEMPDWIAGFACGVPLENGQLLMDFIYVKYPYRNRGIARGLLSAIGWTQGQEIIATHRSRSLEGAYLRYNALYNPYYNMIGFSDA